MAQCLIPNLIVLANRLRNRTGSSTATLPWSDHYIYTHTELDENHTNRSQCQLCEYSCCSDPVSYLLPALSHRGQCPVVLSISEFANVLLKSRIRMSVLGRRGSKALLLALHDKDGASFFIKSEHLL